MASWLDELNPAQRKAVVHGNHGRFRLGDGHSYAQLTRFIPDSVRTLFEERTETPAESSEKTVDAPRAVSAQRTVQAKLGRLWRP